MKPAQANSILAHYREILKYHERSSARQNQQGLSDESLLDLARRNPEVLNLLEPLLTQDQIAMVMGQDDGDVAPG